MELTEEALPQAQSWPQVDRRLTESRFAVLDKRVSELEVEVKEIKEIVDNVKQEVNEIKGGINTIKWIISGFGTALTGLVAPVAMNSVGQMNARSQFEHPPAIQRPTYQHPLPAPPQYIPQPPPNYAPPPTPDTLPPEYSR